MLDQLRALLIDLDGVLYVEDEPIAGPARPSSACARPASRCGS